MRYEKFDFEKGFYMADGGTQELMTLRKFGKILKQRKPVVIEAIRNSGVGINKNATPQQIVATLKRNEGNRKLEGNMALLILFDNELLKAERGYSNLIGTKADGTPRALGTGEGFKNMFTNNDPNKVKGEGWNNFKNWFQKDPNKEKTPFGETGFGKSFNNIFKSQGVDEDGTKIPSKFGQFANDNKEGLFQIGGTLFNGLFNKKGEETIQESHDESPINTDGGGNNKTPANQQASNVPMAVWIVGGLVVIGGIVGIVMATRKS